MASEVGVQLAELEAPSLTEDIDTPFHLRTLVADIERRVSPALARRFAAIGAQLQSEPA
jgi:hypothetical protein